MFYEYCKKNEINDFDTKKLFYLNGKSNSGHVGVGYLTSQLLYEVEK